jgi:predicted methyltransferase
MLALDKLGGWFVFGRPTTNGAFVACLVVLVTAFGPISCGPTPDPSEQPGPGQEHGSISVDAIRSAVTDGARPEEDRARDADRRPVEVLEFLRVEPGMRVAELMAASGYYTEILAGVLGDEGQLYVHNNRFVLDRFAREPLAERLARMRARNVTRLDTELDDLDLPFDLDAVLLIRFYHDLFWMPGPDGEVGTTDRASVNRQVYRALRPGGVYGIVDHHAEAGSGVRDAVDPSAGLHRVDRDLVVREVEAAGFVLEAESDVLANPDDSRDWNIFVDGGVRRDRTDRFVLRFRKPGA